MSMVAEHAKWPKENDIIFSLSERAQVAEKELGKDKVINATIGALMDDNGKLIAMINLKTYQMKKFQHMHQLVVNQHIKKLLKRFVLKVMIQRDILELWLHQVEVGL